MKTGKTQRCAVIAGLTAVFFMALAASAFAAEPAVVRLWNWNIHDKKYQQKMYKLFNQRHPDIRLDYSSIANVVYDQTLEASFIAKDPPELFLPSGKYLFPYLKEKGLVMPLNDVAPSAAELKAFMDAYPPALHKFVEGLSIFSGKIYFVDTWGEQSDYYPLFYNKTVFKDAGIARPPATQSELRDIAKKITQAGQGKYFGLVHGLRWDGTWSMDTYGSMGTAAGGVSLMGKMGWAPDPRDARWHFGNPEYRKIINLWINMRKDGSVYPGEMALEDEQAKMAFATNKAGLEFGAGWNPANFLAYNPDCDFDVVLPPTPDDGVRRGFYYVMSSGGSWGYLVSSVTKNPGAVWEVIKFIASLEYQQGYVQGGYGFSYLPEASKPENFQIKQMYKFVEWALDPNLKKMGPVLSINAQKYTQYVAGVYPSIADVHNNVYLEHSGLEALDDLDRRLDAAFDEGIRKMREAGLNVTRADFTFPDWDPMKDYIPKKK